MDGFADVAKVLHDARYKQAMVDASRRPTQRIPQPGRFFSASHFMEQQGVTCASMMQEPLGRWFLGLFADLDERAAAREAQDGGHGNGHGHGRGRGHGYGRGSKSLRSRSSAASAASADSSYEEAQELEGTGEERRFLKFVEDYYTWRRQDPKGAVQRDTLLGIIEAHRLEELDLVRDFLAASSTLTFEDIVELARAEQQSDRDSDSGSETSSQERPEEGGDVEGEREVPGSPMSARQKARLHTMRRMPSAPTMVLNHGLEDVIGGICAPLFEDFLESRTATFQYCRLKHFALEALSERQVSTLRVLGRGATGQVYACTVLQTGKALAIKSCPKKLIKQRRAFHQIKAERNALELLAKHPSPYCMRLRYAFQTKEHFHLVMPLATAGDLRFHLSRGALGKARATLYAAEIALGLGHIHTLGLVLRDLKPRNILIDGQGHCRISDFGLAIDVSDGRLIKGRAGTMGYWSPEVLTGKEYGFDADWWSYGCCVYEFFEGSNPFSRKHTGLKDRNEGTRKAEIRVSDKMPEEAVDLVLGLLDRNVETRVGCRGRDAEEILDADVFALWDAVDLPSVRAGAHEPVWTPRSGVVYAQPEKIIEAIMQKRQGDLRNVKVTAADLPVFDDFVALEDHMEDIVKVISYNVDVDALTNDIFAKRMRSLKRDKAHARRRATGRLRIGKSLRFLATDTNPASDEDDRNQVRSCVIA